MDEREFRKILKKYRLGQASPEERQIIDAWYDASQQDEFAHERKLNDELETLYLKNITDRIGKPEVATHNVMTTRQIKLISFLCCYCRIAPTGYMGWAIFNSDGGVPLIKQL